MAVPASDAARGAMALKEFATALEKADEQAKAEGQLSQYMQTHGFSPEVAEYITDTLGMYTFADLQYPTKREIRKELPQLTSEQRQLLFTFMDTARTHYDLESLEDLETPEDAAHEWMLRRKEYDERQSPAQRQSANRTVIQTNQYFVG